MYFAAASLAHALYVRTTNIVYIIITIIRYTLFYKNVYFGWGSSILRNCQNWGWNILNVFSNFQTYENEKWSFWNLRLFSAHSGGWFLPLKFQLKSNKNPVYFIFLSKPVKLPLEVYSYDLAYFHPDILISKLFL